MGLSKNNVDYLPTVMLGIDENGLGPVMGPLIVTGILADVNKKDFTWFPCIEDSKRFFRSRNPGSLRKLEETVLAVFLAVYGHMPASPGELVKNICTIPACTHTRNICSENIPSRFRHADIRTAKNKGKEFALWMQQEQVNIRDINCRVMCPFYINKFLRKGSSKSFLDFTLFMHIVEETQVPYCEVIAGKIGGMKRYFPFLKAVFPSLNIQIVEEKKEVSTYLLKNPNKTTRIGFYLNVEKNSFLASLSSIIGKYVRELFMESINESLGNKEKVSGYRDKKTASFIAGNLEQWKSSNIPVDCLLRIK